jgi:hypothetical protein
VKRIRGRHFQRAKSAASSGADPLEFDIQSRIRVELERIGCRVTNLSQRRRSDVTPGTPDLFASHAAWRVFAWLEVKTPDGTRSKVQREWAADVTESGCPVLTVTSAADALTQFGKLPRGTVTAHILEDRNG